MLALAPSRLDETGVETLLGAIAACPGTPEGIDCSGVRFADPYGVLLLAAIGLSAPFRGGRAWGLVLPTDPAVLSWLERCGARDLLERHFVVTAVPEGDSRAAGARRGDPSPVLLEVALVREGADVHRAVARIKARADLLLVARLGYSSLAADRFTVALAEICQNVVDHGGSSGLAAAQFYLGGTGRRPEIRLAVADVGIGVRASLAPRYAGEDPLGFDDRAAVRLAFRRGVSRFEDPGRGLGLKSVAEMVRSWGGTLRLRSGTAAWTVGAGSGPSERLTPFPGTQVSIRLPHAEDGRR